ncbi:hypothetical protein D3C75_491170 [compost metagenome]
MKGCTNVFFSSESTFLDNSFFETNSIPIESAPSFGLMMYVFTSGSLLRESIVSIVGITG